MSSAALGDVPMEWLHSWKGLDMFSEGNLLRENTVAGVLCTLKATQGKQSHTQLLKFHLLTSHANEALQRDF